MRVPHEYFDHTTKNLPWGSDESRWVLPANVSANWSSWTSPLPHRKINELAIQHQPTGGRVDF